MSHPDDLTLQSWHDGEVSDDERAHLASHVETCAQCSAKVDGLRSLARATQRWADAVPELPDDFADLLVIRAESEPPVKSAPPAPVAKVIPLRRRWVYPALAAAAAGLIALRVSLPNRPGGGLMSSTPVLVGGEGSGGATVTRVDMPGAQSFTVMQLPGVRPDTVTAVVWIQDLDDSGGSR